MPQGTGEPGAPASVVDPTSFEAEQYRLLRYQLEQLKRKAGVSVVGITSAVPGDGKTTTSLNLAVALGQAPGARVLLVDGDLRRPCIAASLDLPSGPGLVDGILQSGLELELLTHRRPGLNVTVLPAGRGQEHPYEILRSPRLAALLHEARGSYDFVVIDTPPVLLVPDCRILSEWVDAFLVVVLAHRTPRSLLEEVLRAFEPGKVAGIVFNNDDRPLAGYYHRYAGYPAQRGKR